MNLFRYEVTVDFTEPVLGTVAKNKDLYRDYIASKAFAEGRVPLTLGSAGVTTLAEAEVAAELATVEDLEERGWTGFHQDDGRPFVYDYYWKAFFKDVGNILKDDLKVTNLRSKIENHVFVQPRKVFFQEGLDGPFTTDVLERPLRAQTAQGPRVTLMRSDTIAGAAMRFRLAVLPCLVSETAGSTSKTLVDWPRILQEILSYGELRGTGQWRNGGWGRFTVRDFTPA